jgi:hypothetical protein
MAEWMGEPEMKIEIISDWTVGGSITISGYHHGKFENKGKILQLETNRVFQYSHLSSVSRLPDRQGNYSLITFVLQEDKEYTLLKVSAENFPTESIYKHLEFYWKATPYIIKEKVESRTNNF